MKPQVSIEQVVTTEPAYFVINKEDNGQSQTLDQHFADYQQALDFILEQGWQLKRQQPDSSLQVETRFLKQ